MLTRAHIDAIFEVFRSNYAIGIYQVNTTGNSGEGYYLIDNNMTTKIGPLPDQSYGGLRCDILNSIVLEITNTFAFDFDGSRFTEDIKFLFYRLAISCQQLV